MSNYYKVLFSGWLGGELTSEKLTKEVAYGYPNKLIEQGIDPKCIVLKEFRQDGKLLNWLNWAEHLEFIPIEMEDILKSIKEGFSLVTGSPKLHTICKEGNNWEGIFTFENKERFHLVIKKM